MKTDVTAKFTKRFHNHMHLLIQLNPLETYLLLWCAENMNNECEISTSSQSRHSFINFILRVSTMNGPDKAIIYSDGSVKNAIIGLKKVGFLIKPPEHLGRGWCWVNPEYFCHGSNELRKNLITYIERKRNE